VSLPLARPRPWPLLAGLLALAACSPDGPPTMPQSDPLPTLGRATFQLTIDVASGTVTIAKPSTRVAGGSAGGPSFSLVGDDAIALHASDCTWTDVGKKKRCTFDLALENRLGQTDLMTPTTFPRAPDGVDGILVFPFSSAALGVSGGAATPSPDWDNAPVNFFNDFANCSGKTNDCYPYETYPGPLYGGEFSESRTVGFDVDRNAHTVSAYIVVAADLRDNPEMLVTFAAEPALCGTAELNVQLGTTTGAGNVPLTVGTDAGKFDHVGRGFCSFPLAQVRVLQATLRMSQYEAGPGSYAGGEEVVVDRVDIGAALDGSDFDAPADEVEIGTLSTSATIGFKQLDVTQSLRNAVASSRTKAQFRFRYRDDLTVETEHVRFEGVSDFNGNPMPNPPLLQIRFTKL
jgi:hypothetical protein